MAQAPLQMATPLAMGLLKARRQPCSSAWQLRRLRQNRPMQSCCERANEQKLLRQMLTDSMQFSKRCRYEHHALARKVTKLPAWLAVLWKQLRRSRGVHVQRLQAHHDMALELLGERNERVEALEDDIREMKHIFHSQLSMLVDELNLLKQKQ